MTADVRAVLFDAGNTLVFVEPGRALEVLRPFGAVADEDVFHGAERAARLHLARRLAGDPVPDAAPPEREAWRGYFSTLLAGLDIAPDRRRTAGRALFEAHQRDHMWTRVDPATPPALRRLRDSGLRLAVVSNADGRMPDLLEAVGLSAYFEFVVDSHAVGVEKPDPRIFEMAVERLGVPASHCLYVGDLYAVDVVGSRRAGLRPLLVDPFDGYDALDPPVDRIRGVAELPGWLGARRGA